MNTSPKVSIIVPIYKVEAFLDQCVTSLLNQTLTDIEIILVDDGSPDGCPSKCDSYARQDARVKVIHKQNAGLGFARNSGLAIASGEYVAFVDSDDWVDTTMYETLYATAQREQLDTCFCGFYNYHLSGTTTHKQEVSEFVRFIGREAVDSFLLDMVAPEPTYCHDVKYMMSTCKVLFKRSILETHHIRFHSEREFVSEDMIFQFDYLSKAEAVGFLPQAFYYYRTNPNSLSHTWERKKFDRIILFLEEMDRKLAARFPTARYKKHFYRQCFLYLRNSIKAGCNSSDYHGYHKSARLIHELSHLPLIKEMLHSYEYTRMPLKQRILFIALRYNLYFLTYLYARYC